MESENYVYKKEIDWSTLMEGFTLPLDNQVIFLRNMENFLQRGQSKIIHFFMNGKTYDAKIVNMNNSVERERRMPIRSDIQEMVSCHRHFSNTFSKA